MQPETPTNRAAEEDDLAPGTSIARTLTAYLDRELSEPLREMMDARIAAEPALRSLLEELEAGRALGVGLFEALAREPAPQRLVRVTRSAR